MLSRYGFGFEEDSSDWWGGMLARNPSKDNINILTYPFYALNGGNIIWDVLVLHGAGSEGRITTSSAGMNVDQDGRFYISYNANIVGSIDRYYRTLSFSLRCL